MQLKLNNQEHAYARRRFLATGGAALLLGALPFKAMAQERHSPLRPAKILGKWQTGNRHLTPPGVLAGGMVLAGDTAVEYWSLETGQAKRRWSMPLGDDPATFKPRIDGELALVSGRGFLAVHALSDGRRLWRQEPKSEEFSVPLIAAGRVYAGDGFTLRCFDARVGAELWSTVTDPAIRIHYGPAIKGDTVFLCPGDGVLYAFDAASGKIKWTVDKSEQWQYLRQLHFWGDVLVGGGYHDEVWGLAADDGRVLWRFVAGNFVNSHLVAGKGVYFWSPTGWIYKLNPADGLVQWRHHTVDYVKKQGWNWAPLMAELTATESRLFCLDMKHVLHVLDIESGDETHRLALPPVRAFMTPGDKGESAWVGSLSGELLNLAIG
ncbi:exported hypothetical protein [Rhodospirillaceae bacterium LM-1]|nr:exported hypothetical protein [Rhodospirillaceae bacterium LM-1]